MMKRLEEDGFGSTELSRVTSHSILSGGIKTATGPAECLGRGDRSDCKVIKKYYLYFIIYILNIFHR